MKYLWDTNIVIHYLQQQFILKAEEFIDEVISTEKPNISAINEIELLCWKTVNDQDLITVQNFINNSNIIELEKAIKLKTAEIRKKHSIKLPDAIIAATSIVYDLTLLTRNVADFKKIEGVKILNPFSLGNT